MRIAPWRAPPEALVAPRPRPRTYACAVIEGFRRALPGALVILALLAGCGENGGDERAPMAPVARPADFPQPGGRTLPALRQGLGPGPVLATSVSALEPGRNRFGFALFDRSKKQLADAAVAIYVARAGEPARGPFPARFESLEVKPQFRSESTDSDPDAAQSVYVADLEIEGAGDYEIMGVARLDDRLVATDPVGLRVPRDGPVPEPGEPAVRISTPTVESVGGDANVDKIDTRVPPSTMHEVDFADALGKKPIVLLFATPALCQSRVCGPVVDIAEQVKATRGKEAAFIHMEVFKDNELEKGPRPQVTDWKLLSEPWLFTIDRRGKVAARLEGAFSARELERAVDLAVKPDPRGPGHAG